MKTKRSQVKIGDKDLREIVEDRLASIDGNGAPELATELLTLRREVRRLKGALRMIVRIAESNDYEVNERMDDVRKDAILALKPKRGWK